jgi:hypothetical protein
MNVDAVGTLCLSLPGVTEGIRWDDDRVSSVGGQMFAVAKPGRGPSGSWRGAAGPPPVGARVRPRCWRG